MSQGDEIGRDFVGRETNLEGTTWTLLGTEKKRRDTHPRNLSHCIRARTKWQTGGQQQWVGQRLVRRREEGGGGLGWLGR